MGSGNLCGEKSLICFIEKRNTLLLGLLLAISVINLWAQIYGQVQIASVSKALVIPALALWAFKRFNPSKLYGFALLFSWFGDLLLIPDGTVFFISGILAFWATQLVYCNLMLRHLEGSFLKQFSKKEALFPLIILGGYLAFMLSLMWPRLGVLQLPVSLYATTLTITGFLGTQIAIQHNNKRAKILALGTLLFVISDSMIAFDAFYFGQAQFTFWIMATYIPAQYCIAIFLAPSEGEK